MYSYYSRQEIKEQIAKSGKNKELGVKYGDKGFGKRPDMVQFESDIQELAKQGATSFHITEETWTNPLELKAGMTRRQLDDLRKGWDLLIDIDSPNIEHSKIIAKYIIEALKFHDVKSIFCKFSVVGGTKVLTKIGGKYKLLPIRQVIREFKNKKEVKVLSLDKNSNLTFSKVYDTLEHKDKTFEIYYQQSKYPIKVTEYHSVFCWDKGNITQKKVSDLKKGDFLITYNSSDKIKKETQTIINEFKSRLNKREDTKKVKIKPTRDLMRLIGYYLAEGHATGTNYQVGFSFNKTEERYIKDATELIKKIMKKKPYVRYPNKSTAQLIIYSQGWYNFFKKFCGIKKNKQIPDFAWILPKHYFLQLLLGYVRGDGNKKDKYSLIAKSVSDKLTVELIWLCKMNGISCTLHSEKNKPHKLPQGNEFKGSFVKILCLRKSDLPLKEFKRNRNKFSGYPRDKTYPVDGLREVYKQIKPKKFNQHRREQMTLKKKTANLERIRKVINWFEKNNEFEFSGESKKIIKNYKKLFNCDISCVPVKEIKTLSKKENVYDVSVKNTESFFGGEYPILLHNSGNKGFHIAVPFEAFPKKINDKETRLLFPEGPKTIMEYVSDMIKKHALNEMPDKEIKDLELDSVLISSRHMFRAPYSLHEKSGLVSIPILPEEIENFEKSQAEPSKVKADIAFLDREKVEFPDAEKLIIQAFDWQAKQKKQEELRNEMFDAGNKRGYPESDEKVPEKFFPESIKKGLEGLEDGKKRFLFILLNFLRCMNWDYNEIEKRIKEWNQKNFEPLKENYLLAQLSWHKRQKDKIPPPNYDNAAYYKDLRILLEPDHITRKFKNPANYANFRYKTSKT